VISLFDLINWAILSTLCEYFVDFQCNIFGALSGFTRISILHEIKRSFGSLAKIIICIFFYHLVLFLNLSDFRFGVHFVQNFWENFVYILFLSGLILLIKLDTFYSREIMRFVHNWHLVKVKFINHLKCLFCLFHFYLLK